MLRALTLEDRIGDIEIRCRDRRAPDGRVEMEIDASRDHGCLRLQLIGPAGEVVCERLVRTTPSSVLVRVPAPGCYLVEVSPLGAGGSSSRKTLTWSDWDEMASGRRGGSRGTQLAPATGAAVLRVA
jgi:hypothetical protein